jgi:RNA polymerase sigma-70 factor, ECF subfamily
MAAHLRLVHVPPPEGAPRLAESDAELVKRMRAGDEAAAAAVWRRYAVVVRGIVVRSIGPCAEIDDVVQDAFAALYRRLPSLRDPSALRSFLIGIALREVASVRRRRVRRWLRLTETGDLPEQAVEGVDGAEREAFRRMHRILDLFDPRMWLAFVLRFVEGLELDRIADALGCSLATTKRTLSRAEQRFTSLAKQDAVLASYVVDAKEDA